MLSCVFYLQLHYGFAGDSISSECDGGMTTSSESGEDSPKAPLKKRLKGADVPLLPLSASDMSLRSLSRPSSHMSLSSDTRFSSLSRPGSHMSLHSCKKNPCPIFEIAIIGGGGAGSVIASLLSNMSAEDEDVCFMITIFERNPHIINGSTFETAAVLHAGGYEYPQDSETAAECRLAGGLFTNMFPGLYSAPSQPIVYAAVTGSVLSPEAQKVTHQKALSLNAAQNVHCGVDFNSPRDIKPELIQSMYSSKLAGGIVSKKDQKMKIFKRNALLKKHIKDSRYIRVKNNVTVHRIVKDEANRFEVVYQDGSRDETKFDHVILTAWDQTNAILKASCDAEVVPAAMESIFGASGTATCGDEDAPAMEDKSSPFVQLSAAHRVVAVVDIRHVPPCYRIPIFVMPDGAMFMPLNDEIGIAYRCAEGASYPKDGTSEIDEQDVPQHGEKIIEELKDMFKRTDDTEAPLEEMSLLGARLQTIVTRSGTHLSKRRYEPPIITPEGLIVAIPLKATFIGSLALQTIEQLLMKLPESCSTFKQRWIQKIKTVIPSNDCLYKEVELPEAFTIKEKTELSEEDIDQEVLLYMESCQLNKAGEAMREGYKDTCDEVRPALRRAQSHSTGIPGFYIGSEDFFTPPPPFALKRSVSDPYAEQGCRKIPAIKARSPYFFELAMLHYERALENKA